MKMFLFTLVLLFIIRIRFPVGRSISTVLRQRYGEPVVTMFRRYERIHFKVEKCRLDLEFLTECLNNQLMPNFLRIKLWKNDRRHKRAYKNFQRKLLELEIQNKIKEINRLKDTVNKCFEDLKRHINTIDTNHVKCFIQEQNSKKLRKVKAIHVRKLFNLGIDKQKELDPNKVVFNYSDVTLSNSLKTLLAKGLQYALPPNRLNFGHFFLPFEKLLRSLKNHNLSNDTPQAGNYVTTKIKELAFSVYYSFNHRAVKSNISGAELKELKQLSKNKEIIVTKPDKGQGVVLMNKTDYNNKVLNVLNDHTKFTEIKDNCLALIIKIEDKLNRLLRKLKNLEIIDNSTFSSLYATGSKPGVLYGLPKIHKLNIPIRPILSAIGTVNYKIAKFFIPILRTLTTNNYTIQDTFTFVQTLLSIPDADQYIMASFDVTSLFTNVPLDETIDIILQMLFEVNETVNGLNKNQFRNLLELATKDIMFYFNGKLYKQIDGVAMGSPLGPTLANIFMCFYEQQWLRDCPEIFKPSHYFRYVDDTFLLFKSRDQVENFLNYMNSKHPNIKFTCEYENQNTLSFLDIRITKENNSFVTSIFRKPTNTGLTMKYDSFLPSRYKENLISILIYRAFKISKSYVIMVKEFSFIKNLLQQNGFPLYLIEKVIRKTLDNLMNPKPVVLTVPKDKIVFKLPYMGPLSNLIIKKLKKVLRANFTTVDIRPIFVNTRSIGSFFSFKDKIPISICSSVIYNYTCGACDASYIGKTTRNLSIRIDEHLGVSYRTKQPLVKPMSSSIRDHMETHGHPVKRENFSVMDSVNLDYDLCLLESLWIWKSRPSLNDYLSSTKLEVLS